MGANPTQAWGIILFILAFVAVSTGLFLGSMLPLLAGVVLLGVSAALFMKAKPWEHMEG